MLSKTDTGETLYSLGYGIITGTRDEKRDKFVKRLQYIQRGIGKPLTVVDIRKAASGSRNGIAFAMRSDGMASLVRGLGFVYTAETYLANEWGGAKWQLESYQDELHGSLLVGNEIAKALGRIVAIAKDDSRGLLLLCGCKNAFKPNGHTWNCHRVPLSLELERELGDGWRTVHL